MSEVEMSEDERVARENIAKLRTVGDPDVTRVADSLENILNSAREENLGFNVVPWPVVDDEPVYTNAVVERALGLDRVIMGWGAEGFYVDGPVDECLRVTESIDWNRVATLSREFAFVVPDDENILCISENPVRFVPEEELVTLYALCFKATPIEEFNSAVEVMAAKYPDKEIISGHLFPDDPDEESDE